MTTIVPAPPYPARVPGEPRTVGTLAAELAWMQYHDDWWAHMLLERDDALEEALTDRRARRRLRPSLRASVRCYAWAGETFYARRLEHAHNAYMKRLDGCERAA